ncbi:uncharacterized protein LOC122723882 [Manihot esculenta]|uniref:uncharacterized protein LOC122723882 n=1 Tax=Manihot esculenta TaxID=3983 RepID=UPI001CC52E35|nr:uncharacterized protein LOC122723882 [Manihot esculenta]
MVELKKDSGLSWEVELSWEDVLLGCNDLPQLSLTEQVGFLRLTSVDKKYDVERCMFVSTLQDCRAAASNVKMDQIKPPKNFTLSRESMNAALDVLRAGRSVSEATQEVAQVSAARTERAPRVTDRSVEDPRHVRTDVASSLEDVPKERAQVTPVDRRASSGEMEVLGASVEIAPAAEDVLMEGVESELKDSIPPREESSVAPEGAVEEATNKRPPPSEAPAPAPVPKSSRASRRPAPALPPLEKEKTPVVPLLSATDNEILNAEDITHQSPASVVAEILRKRMFGGLQRLRTLVMGLFMEVDARDHSLREFVDRRIEEARLEENLSATSDARGNLAMAHEHSKSLQVKLSYTLDALKRADEKAAAVEIRCDEALKQLSSLEEVRRERDEAVSQKNKVWHQYKALKADSEAAQTHYDAVIAQREEALARIVVLEQELIKHANSEKDLALAAEASRLQNQHLCQEVEALKRRCSALLEDAKHAEDRVQLECEERLREYKESAELKKEIEQACEALLQSYKDSSELKAKIAEAYEARLAKFKASDEMKNAIWHKGFRMFVSSFNRGLREARHALSTPLAQLRALEIDSDGEEVHYGEDDRPFPKGVPHIATESLEEGTELKEGDGQETAGPEEEGVESLREYAGPQEGGAGSEIVPYVGPGAQSKILALPRLVV